MTDRLRYKYSINPPVFAKECLGFTPDPVQSLVLDPTVRRGILNCSRQWGKSSVTAVKAVHRAYFSQGQTILVVSSSGRQSGEFVRKAELYAAALGLQIRGDGYNEISLLFPNGSRIVALPSTDATNRGFSAPALLILDEASRISDRIYMSLRPMLATGDGQLWLLSTPNGKQGFFYRQWHTNGNLWTRISVKATECPRISASFLAEERTQMTDAMFRQEYLCEFTEAEDAFFSEESVDRCVVDGIEPLY